MTTVLDAIIAELNAEGLSVLQRRGGRDPELVDWFNRVQKLAGSNHEGLSDEVDTLADDVKALDLAHTKDLSERAEIKLDSAAYERVLNDKLQKLGVTVQGRADALWPTGSAGLQIRGS